ncbi:MAG: methylmalonyl-CoA epimerase [Thermaerobacterales bacterium]
MFGTVDHIGIAVEDLDRAVELYGGRLGLTVSHPETVADQGVQVAMLPVGSGGARVELLAPTGADSPVARFIARRGPGLHHLAFGVTDIIAALDEARRAGLRLIDEEPRRGAGGALIAFVHPGDTMGTLIELCQHD